MKYNFDEEISRENSNCIKYDFKKYGKAQDIIPLWVADMDFRAPREVVENLLEISRHGIFGYTDAKEDYFEAVYNWFNKKFTYKPQAQFLVKTPGVVFALAMAVRAFTSKGDAILIQEPVYHPFASKIMLNERKLVVNELLNLKGHYEVDFDDFENKIKLNKVKLFILCSPHNPVGRVWSENELRKMGEICLRHNCLILSDEIHCDFVFSPHKHLVFSTLSEDFEKNSIICTAPSKTFNLAGLQVSNIFIAAPDLRQKFIAEIEKSGFGQPTTMGLSACQSAYNFGEEWLNQLIDYLSGNINYVKSFLKDNFPQIKLSEPEGTYLLWLDFRELGLDENEINDLLINKAKLWLNEGKIFGSSGSGFQRMNIACPKLTLEKALSNLKKALS